MKCGTRRIEGMVNNYTRCTKPLVESENTMKSEVILHNPSKHYRGPDMEGLLTYVNGTWEREVNCRWFHVAKSGWFRKQWAVYRFAGADTAALGTGAVWYDRVSTFFDNEYEAIKAMAAITEDRADDLGHLR